MNTKTGNLIIRIGIGLLFVWGGYREIYRRVFGRRRTSSDGGYAQRQRARLFGRYGDLCTRCHTGLIGTRGGYFGAGRQTAFLMRMRSWRSLC